MTTHPRTTPTVYLQQTRDAHGATGYVLIDHNGHAVCRDPDTCFDTRCACFTHVQVAPPAPKAPRERVTLAPGEDPLPLLADLLRKASQAQREADREAEAEAARRHSTAPRWHPEH